VLGVTLTGANVHDKWMVGQTLDAVVVRAPRGPRRPKNLCLDKGYDDDDAEAAVVARGIKPHLRRRGDKRRKAEHSMALVHLACALIAYRAATRRNGHQF
jgi:hypothetical protein